MFDVSEVRRRLRQRIEEARQAAVERRAQADTASRHYQQFLERTATPVFRMFATALRAEGLPFEVSTPAGFVRIAGARSGDDFIEIGLDTSGAQPTVMGRASRGRGRGVVTRERPIREGVPIESLTADDVLAYLLAEIEPFVI